MKDLLTVGGWDIISGIRTEPNVDWHKHDWRFCGAMKTACFVKSDFNTLVYNIC